MACAAQAGQPSPSGHECQRSPSRVRRVSRSQTVLPRYAFPLCVHLLVGRRWSAAMSLDLRSEKQRDLSALSAASSCLSLRVPASLAPLLRAFGSRRQSMTRAEAEAEQQATVWRLWDAVRTAPG